MLWTIELLVALLISGLAILAAVWPLLKKGPTPAWVEDDQLLDLLHRKEQVLLAIKDLEFDYRVGKLSEEDYRSYDQQLRRQAIALLAQIEKVAPESAQLDASLEQEILQRRKVRDKIGSAVDRNAKGLAHTSKTSNSVEDEQQRPRLYCTQCGHPLDPHYRFCAMCGAPVESVAAVKRS
ncbi:MAG: zinc ribbon domain-containing protein [Caldilinea sp.]|nr:zinc ribbon domain-containing protein [Caldilinea sp.]MDW8440705.1 zinc ribbon domain-containing protein [Caldilineaceae bacterium]